MKNLKLKETLNSIFQNPQNWQNAAIGSILLTGKILGFIAISWGEIGIVLGLAVFLDFWAKRFFDGESRFPFSALNTGIGICFFLRSEIVFVYIFTVFLAIFSKYLIRFRGQHFLNPSYSAIFLTLVIFPQIAYTNPLQWGVGNIWPILLMVTLGSFVLWRAKALEISAVFFATFLACWAIFTQIQWFDFQNFILTGSFFIAAIFGFTDPRTIPRERIDRVFFAAQIAIWFFVLRHFINENYALFAGYFLVNLSEPAFQILGQNARKIFTGILFLTAAGLAGAHFLEFGILPDFLTNRCNQLFCRPVF